MTEYKPCPNPWCPCSDPQLVCIAAGKYLGYCDECGIKAQISSTPDDAIRLWNDRPEDAEIERLRRLAEFGLWVLKISGPKQQDLDGNYLQEKAESLSLVEFVKVKTEDDLEDCQMEECLCGGEEDEICARLTDLAQMP